MSEFLKQVMENEVLGIDREITAALLDTTVDNIDKAVDYLKEHGE